MRKARLAASESSSADEGAINLTPLIDVVFVVLIMFIIIAPMLELDRVQLAGAPETAKNNLSSSTLAIYVQADNSIWIGKQRVLEKELLSLLKEAKRSNPGQIPQLFHDKKAQFGTYQTVKNAVESAGFEQLDVILQPGG
ncbi:MAG: biopolymer transporter ExbD [Verrucomicrobia bacterium]|nr:biopolymer transporter ExbD [Verrucomicrobiota bacterium]